MLFRSVRGTLGTHTPTVHASGSRTEAAGENLVLPGISGVVGVAHTVTANVSSNANIQIDSVAGISAGMTVTGNNVVTSTVVSTSTNQVILATPQTLTRGTVLSFGDIVAHSVRPFTTVNTNSLTAYHNTWNTLGSGVATDGQGLQLSTTDIAVFLLNNPAELP